MENDREYLILANRHRAIHAFVWFDELLDQLCEQHPSLTLAELLQIAELQWNQRRSYCEKLYSQVMHWEAPGLSPQYYRFTRTANSGHLEMLICHRTDKALALVFAFEQQGYARFKFIYSKVRPGIAEKIIDTVAAWIAKLGCKKCFIAPDQQALLAGKSTLQPAGFVTERMNAFGIALQVAY